MTTAPLWTGDERSGRSAVAKWRRGAAARFTPSNQDMMRAAFDVISKTMLAGGALTCSLPSRKGHADYYNAAIGG